MRNLTVSVIIPVFNGAAYIRGAIESVLNQTLKDVEIIVVDDGSTDETFSVIEPWIKENRVRYIRQNNKGLSGARNTGISLAAGEFIKFLDADDLLHPQQLERQTRHLANKPDHFISVTDFEFEYENKTRKYSKVFLGRMSPLARFISGNLGPPHIFLVRRSIIERIGGFDENLPTAEDSDFWLRAMIKGCVVEKVDYNGCVYRILGGSLDSDAERRLKNISKVYEKLNRSLLPELKDLPDEVLEQLLLKNFSLVHRCFKMQFKPASYLPTALKVNHIIYANKMDGLRKVLLKMVGVENLAFLKYAKAYLTDRDYYDKLNVATWRNMV
jgi:glycosyltransferase involved in cell wall biosynthesis